jgi:hypothetical protein
LPQYQTRCSPLEPSEGQNSFVATLTTWLRINTTSLAAARHTRHSPYQWAGSVNRLGGGSAAKFPPFSGPQIGCDWIEQAPLLRNYPGVTRSISHTAADLPLDAPIRDRIIALRQDGLSIAGIAKRLQVPHAEVLAVITDWAAGYFGPNRRNDMLAILTARLERIFQAHKDKAYRGDVQATNACLRCCAHLSALHGLYQPSIAVANNSTSNVMIDRCRAPTASSARRSPSPRAAHDRAEHRPPDDPAA